MAYYKQNLSSLKELKKAMKRWPKRLNWAAAGTLNEYAFRVRQYQMDEITSKMTVRSPGFVKASIRWQKTSGRKPINSQLSETGSVLLPYSSGFKEQQTGERTRRDRLAYVAGRGGSPSKRIIDSARVRPANDFEKPGKYHGDTPRRRIVDMLVKLSAKNYRKPFIIHGDDKTFEPGVYRFGKKFSDPKKASKRRLSRLVTFSMPASKTQPKRIRWHSTAVQHYFDNHPAGKTWALQIQRQLDKIKQRFGKI